MKFNLDCCEEKFRDIAVAMGVDVAGLSAKIAAEQAVTDTYDSNKRTAFWGTPRAPMTIAVSEDGGQTWPTMKDIEVGDGYCMTNNSKEKLNREYSYPSIKQTPDGRIHITFTYFRQTIKYVCVSEEWVKA